MFSALRASTGTLKQNFPTGISALFISGQRWTSCPELQIGVLQGLPVASLPLCHLQFCLLFFFSGFFMLKPFLCQTKIVINFFLKIQISIRAMVSMKCLVLSHLIYLITVKKPNVLVR